MTGIAAASSLEVLALCIGNAVGFGGTSAIPLWVAAMIKSSRLSAVEVGWLASGELFLQAGSVFGMAMFAKRVSPRRIASTAACVIVAANAMAMIPATLTLIIGRLLSGVAMGSLVAAVTRIAAHRADAQRILSLMQAAMVVLVSMLFFSSSTPIGRFGPAGVFALLAVAGAVVAVVSRGLPDNVAFDVDTVRAASGRKIAPLLGCVALTLVFVGQGSVWNYIVLIGNGLGIDAHTLGVLLALVPPLAMLGPLASHVLGERVGLLWPLLLSLAVLATDALLLVDAGSPFFFCLYSSVLNVAILFFVPYAIALLGRIDASGRFAGAAPAFMMIGGSISPTLGGKVIESAHFPALAWVAVSCITVSIVLFSIAVGIGGINTSLRELQK